MQATSKERNTARTRIYLDHNATSPLRPRVRKRMIETMEEAGNPSSIHKEGRQARSVIEQAREKIGALVGARAREVLFTSGGTEANNTALSPHLVAGACGTKSRETADEALCYVSEVEHPSVLAGGRFAPSQLRKLRVDHNGLIDFEGLIAAFEADGIHLSTEPGANPPFMVSVMLANNETGVIQPVTEIASLVLERGGLMHSDAVQALGRVPFDLASLGVDLLSLAAHKAGGPKGIGALVGPAVDKVLGDPLLRGGGQEAGCRAGTENVVAVAGFAEAAEMACEELADREMIRFLRDRMETRMRTLVPDLVILGEAVDRLDNTSLLAVPGLEAEKRVIALDLAGIAVSAGSACSSGKVKKSHVLDAMGVTDNIARCALRISFGPQNWLYDIDRLVAAMDQSLQRRKKKEES